MEKYDIYQDISLRTGGNIYIGVVGPVRTGKSTFITSFMNKLVIPNMVNKLQRQIATDEMPQSADGKTIMTTQPKFVPSEAVKIHLKNKATASVRLIDCVGYFVDGAYGNMENEKPRKVKTPWSDEDIPFEKAAEIGTKKVIDDYSTIGILVTTDGSIGEIERDNYVPAEEKAVNELKEHNKPFIILLNCKDDKNENSIKLSYALEEKYGVPVVCKNVLNMSENDISDIMEKVIMEFPLCKIDICIPKWMQALSVDNPIIEEVIKEVKSSSKSLNKMRDFSDLNGIFSENENFNPLEIEEILMGEGTAKYNLTAKEGLFYKVVSHECGDEIKDDYELMSFIKGFSESKKRFAKIKDALDSAEENGYGVVLPTIDEMNLQEPELVKQGGRYGVKLKASAPSLHIMKVDVETEVSPIVGTEKQGEDMVKFLMEQFEENPEKIWETDMFGKSLNSLVNEGLSSKLNTVPNEAKTKMRKTLTKIVNENKGGLICILL